MDKRIIESLYQRVISGKMSIDKIPDGAVKEAVQKKIDENN